MLNPTIIIDGLEIRHFKTLDRIEYSRIHFEDGAWCDARTLTVSSNARCQIAFLNTPLAGDYMSFRCSRIFHHADIISISNLRAELIILPSQDKTITIGLQGPNRFIISVSMRQDLVSGALLIHQGDTGPRRELLDGRVILLVPNNVLINFDQQRHRIIVENVDVELEFDQ